jgi:hypothetical protein
MLTLHYLLTTARRFVDGVCAIPSMGPKLDDVSRVLGQAYHHVEVAAVLELREEVVDVQRDRDAWCRECESLRREISAERDRCGAVVKSEHGAFQKALAIARESHDVTRKQLAAERETHETTRERFKQALCGLGVSDISVARFLDGDEVREDFVTSRDHDIIDQIDALRESERELSVARADLEALTTESINVAWTQARSAWEEGYLIGLQSHEGRSTPGGQPYDAPANPYDLVKPESLAAWKSREGGGDGK